MDQSLSIYKIPNKWEPTLITHEVKKKILDRICQIYNNIDNSHFSNIFIKQKSVIIDNKLLNTIIDKKFNEDTVDTPYDFRSKFTNHVYANHANIRIGGGMFSFGFVQEEQLLIKSTLMFPIYENRYCSENILGNIDLERNCLLARCNIFVHQNTNMNLYGGPGMKIIQNNPNILDNFYKPHNTNPKIFILSKAIPVFKNSYKTFIYDGVPIVEWIFYSAYNSYLFAIETLDKCNDVNEIIIHDGNWGCGVYNHNVNTIYCILHLAFRAACLHFTSTKQIRFVYHTYDRDTYNKLDTARFFLANIGMGMTVGKALEKIKSYHIDDDILWSIKK